ncbi:uncharacterized protein EI90DRAFT_3092154 [Cantharellus anzutake]|uniref:uncharacterized protein n=1 Tax=Cantharellus anzutake TaxID=1750568 RepID=UPI0019046539|nr:uncharacterized protein EI90DRAFT_3092154 [Cantharellus anzutake]KAF8313303.1 hypothetical protein EI90DRAFT_3092154 [Cantharellus anzutake]
MASVADRMVDAVARLSIIPRYFLSATSLDNFSHWPPSLLPLLPLVSARLPEQARFAEFRPHPGCLLCSTPTLPRGRLMRYCPGKSPTRLSSSSGDFPRCSVDSDVWWDLIFISRDRF